MIQTDDAAYMNERVSLYDKVQKKFISGSAAPKRKNLALYLPTHPHCEIYVPLAKRRCIREIKPEPVVHTEFTLQAMIDIALLALDTYYGCAINMHKIQSSFHQNIVELNQKIKNVELRILNNPLVLDSDLKRDFQQLKLDHKNCMKTLSGQIESMQSEIKLLSYAVDLLSSTHKSFGGEG